MSQAEARTIRRSDYRPPAWLVDDLALDFDLDPGDTRVTARLKVRRNPDVDDDGPLVLDRDGPRVESVRVDDESWPEDRVAVRESAVILSGVPDACTVETVCRIRPADNTQLEGLYQAGESLLTQCEAEGFRRITPFPDRPDVMTRYRVRLEADRTRYPVLLSNGNRVEQGNLDGDRHFAVFEDPFPKPSYLFALVAGDLDVLEDAHVTPDGRTVHLHMHAPAALLDRLSFAMASLKEAMKFDEEVYGLTCDLDEYHVVATYDYNMGAMENKGLNIFNAKCLLASPGTATDADYQTVEAVVAHEYFHNWTGNRVTCRDWFQLSLKEGLTVFREQQFAEQHQSAIRRIDDADMLRSSQFPEDAGPMAHPVRPDEYEDINNFYTLTVYEKGAAVVRMYHTLLGAEGFRKGMDLYFERHDGQAVTCDDFRMAMADANGRDLDQFGLWYSQAGTPEVEVETHWDKDATTLTLTLRQHCPATPGQPEKKPMLIPVAVGLLDRGGRELALTLRDETSPGPATRVLELTEPEQRYVFTDVPEHPVASLLRGFSAPVKLRAHRSHDELAFLVAHDSDPFARWDAARALQTDILLRLIEDLRAQRTPSLPAELIQATAHVLADETADPALVAELIRLPGETYLADQMEVADVDAVHRARSFARERLAEGLGEQWLARHQVLAGNGPYRPRPADIGRRRLRNQCLDYIAAMKNDSAVLTVREQYRHADNLTDRMAALSALVHDGLKGWRRSLDDFYRRWGDDPLIADKWLAVQATIPDVSTVERVESLTDHECFDWKNPNKLYALIRSFSRDNPVGFHRDDGAGYRFLADAVLRLDERNSQIAAVLVRALEDWRRYDEQRRGMMQAELERIGASSRLSRATGEIVHRALE